MEEIVVIGFDCGRGVGCFCVSKSRPLDPDKFVNQTKFEFVSADQFGLAKLLSHKSQTGRTLIAIEPTGKDSRVWIDNLKLNGFEVHLVSNNLLRHYAEASLGWNNKTDPYDAAALLIYCWDKLLNEKAFLKQKDEHLQLIHNFYLELQSQNRRLTALINQARAALAVEWPEKQKVQSEPTTAGDFPPFWAFIAGWLSTDTTSGQRKFSQYERSRLESIGSAATNGFSPFLSSKAQAICLLEVEKLGVEKQLRSLLEHPRYAKYVQVLKSRFQVGAIEQAIIISQIYPFEQFLNEGGNPRRETKRNNTASGKPTRQNRGEREFHACLGMAPHQRSSGQKQGMVIQGSAMARSALWRWVHCKIEPNPTYKDKKTGLDRRNPSVLNNDIGILLREQLNRDKQNVSQLQGELMDLLGDDIGSNLLETLKKVQHPRIGVLIRVLEEVSREEKAQRRKAANPQNKIRQGISGALGRQARSRAMARLVKLLFRELLAAFRDN